MESFQYFKLKKRSYPYYNNESNLKIFYPILKTDYKNEILNMILDIETKFHINNTIEEEISDISLIHHLE